MMRKLVSYAAVSVASVSMLVPIGVARAEEEAPPRIVVLSGEEARALAVRMSDELGTMGFDASTALADPEAPLAEELELTAKESDAVAAVEVTAHGGSVRVWVFDRTTGKILSRDVAVSPTDRAPALAVLAVELLRASLLELNLRDAPRGDIPVTNALLEAVDHAPRQRPTQSLELVETSTHSKREARPSARVSLDVGAGVLASPGGLEPERVLSTSAGVFVIPQLRIGVYGVIPMTPMHLDEHAGSADIYVGVVGADVQFEAPFGMFRPTIGGGMAAVVLSLKGDGREPFYLDTENLTAALGVYVRPGFGIEPTPLFDVRLEGLFGAQFLPFAIYFADRHSAMWGPVWGGGFVTLEARLP
ncbi:MAG: hypothetical protein U0271_35880 [Polyangiaceae bacterium]